MSVRLPGDPTIDVFRERLLEALLAADRRAAEGVVDDAMVERRDGVAILDELLAPAMREVGRLWSTGRISIADEHLATAIGHTLLVRIYPSLVTGPPSSRGRVLLAGVDGEQHLFGLRMIADALEGAGYDVRNVAGALPPDAIVSAVRRHRPRLVGLADTMGSTSALRRSIEALRAAEPAIPILLGGPAAADAADVTERCEVCGSARDALAAAQRLLPSVTG